MTHTSDQVLAEVNRIFCEVLENDSIELKNETTANDVKGWDSLSHIELVVAVEKHFKIRFNFAEIQKFKNVGEMCDNIAVKLAARDPKSNTNSALWNWT
jgi:acyl carrier protein